MPSLSPCKPPNNRSSPPQPPRYGLNDLPPQGIPDIVSSRASFNGVPLTIGYLCLLRCISWHTTRIMLGGHAGIVAQLNGLPRGPVCIFTDRLLALGEPDRRRFPVRCILILLCLVTDCPLLGVGLPRYALVRCTIFVSLQLLIPLYALRRASAFCEFPARVSVPGAIARIFAARHHRSSCRLPTCTLRGFFL